MGLNGALFIARSEFHAPGPLRAQDPEGRNDGRISIPKKNFRRMLNRPLIAAARPAPYQSSLQKSSQVF